MQINVFIVSNVRLHRDGLVELLRGCPSIKVLGADSMQETQNVLRTTATDVALIDAPSPGNSELVRVLRQICARIRILAVGIRETATEVLACAAAGIDGYVPMDAALGDMVVAIENVVRGELTCSPKVAASLYQNIGFSRGGRRQRADRARASGRRVDESRLPHQGNRMALGNTAQHGEEPHQEHFAQA